jgi:hypothetical protein
MAGATSPRDRRRRDQIASFCSANVAIGAAPVDPGGAARDLLRLTRTGDRAMLMHALVERIRGEFLEMPGLQLTVAEAARLWGLDLKACQHVVEVLVAASFLRWTRNGKIARAERG